MWFAGIAGSRHTQWWTTRESTIHQRALLRHATRRRGMPRLGLSTGEELDRFEETTEPCKIGSNFRVDRRANVTEKGVHLLCHFHIAFANIGGTSSVCPPVTLLLVLPKAVFSFGFAKAFPFLVGGSLQTWARPSSRSRGTLISSLNSPDPLPERKFFASRKSTRWVALVQSPSWEFGEMFWTIFKVLKSYNILHQQIVFLQIGDMFKLFKKLWNPSMLWFILFSSIGGMCGSFEQLYML